MLLNICEKYDIHTLIFSKTGIFLFHSLICVCDIRAMCRMIPGLSSEQMDLCYRANDVTRAALDGLDLAVRECQQQVRSIYKNTVLIFI